MAKSNLHEAQIADRTAHTEAIVSSDAPYKVIVAGAGTGKSFTFKSVLKTKASPCLALTFINNLAADLQKDLGELAEAYTFHAFCKKLLHQLPVKGIDNGFHYYPKLPLLVLSDAKLLDKNLENFEPAFHTLTEDERIEFFLERGSYYNAVSHSDAVFRVLKYLQSGGEDIPTYNQIVVDEYQDFNPLEVAFIEELLKTSPVLIVGDDDQAIYDFKNASPDFVREKANNPDFQKFELPYCSRCTEVIVNAVHDITDHAQWLELLQNRIEKKYVCYLPDKEADSAKYPQIVHASCSTHTSTAPYISKYIEIQLKAIPQEEIDEAKEKGFPCVLIAGPSWYTKQVYSYLKEAGFSNIEFPEEKEKGINILEGYKILMKDDVSNLGWRIVLECSKYEDLANVIYRSYADNEKLNICLKTEFKDFHIGIVQLLNKLLAEEELTLKDKQEIESACSRSLDDVKKFLGIEEEEVVEDGAEVVELDPGPTIKIATINGSKGLSANHVFLVGMNNTTSIARNGLKMIGFPADGNNPSDNEICQLIVGITRTRKKCHLISNGRFGQIYNMKKSSFIDWIDSERIENVTVNKDYFIEQE